MADKSLLNILRIRAMDAEEIWRTIRGAKVLIDKGTGKIRGGAGGKMNGMTYKPGFGRSLKTGKRALKSSIFVKGAFHKGTKADVLKRLKKAVEPPKPTREQISKKAADIRDFKHKFSEAKTMDELRDLRKKYDEMVGDIEKDLKDFDTSSISSSSSDFEDKKLRAGDYVRWMKKSGDKYFDKAKESVAKEESKASLTQQWEDIKKVAYSLRRSKNPKFKIKQQEKLRELYDKFTQAEEDAPAGGTISVKRGGIIDLIYKDFSAPTGSTAEALRGVASAFSGAGLPSSGERDKISVEREQKAKSTTLRRFTAHSQKYADKVRRESGLSPAQEKEYVEKFKKLLDESDYVRRIKPHRLESIIKSGFKNQFETGTSAGAYTPTTRRSLSKQLFGHDGSMEGKDYEKYGFLAPKDMSIKPMAGWYGDVVVRFKKDRLKGRTTYTIGDSLDYRHSDWVAGDCDNPSLAGVQIDEHSDSAKKAYQRMKKAKTINDLAIPGRIDGYVELQFHGPLDIDDVASVTVPSGFSDTKVLGMLRAKGIKVYQSSDSGAPREMRF